ncbi:MAG: UDP-N-acetylmuramate dehydrogenase [Solirubrobacteraceae bacterium]|nr:UDP-N-acetylmuramate dehydrogenase [Solirubrobacteraceae bacterium]
MRLSELTTLRLGGPAGAVVEARSEAELLEVVRSADGPLLLVAGGSNLVVADEGFAGTVVRVLTAGVEERERDGRVELTVQAGEEWEPFVARCVAEGLAGVESLSGIPGSIGATPIQNVGAYGQDVAETVVSVRVLDRERETVEDLPAADCGFAYRSSAFKRTPGRWVVLAVTFALERRELSAPLTYAELARTLGVEPGEGPPLADVRAAVLALRRGKGMVLDPADPDSVSAGSFFTNPILAAGAFAALEERAAEHGRPPRFPEPDGRVKTSAAWLIEHAGFRRGHGNPSGIAISSKHTLALTNRGEGTTVELLALAREIAGGVRDRFGVALEPEPTLVGVGWP